jgi:YfiR/HmsC-like
MQRFFLTLVIIFCAAGSEVIAQTTNHQVYALYVVNIAKYSSWPNVNGELKVAVFGKSKVYDELAKQNGKLVNGSTLKVYQAEQLANVADAHILYLADGKSGTLDEVLKATEGQSVMIITEREGLHKKGAGFSFIIMENSSLRFDMNHTELEKRSIKVSKSLATLAHSSI